MINKVEEKDQFDEKSNNSQGNEIEESSHKKI